MVISSQQQQLRVCDVCRFALHQPWRPFGRSGSNPPAKQLFPFHSDTPGACTCTCTCPCLHTPAPCLQLQPQEEKKQEAAAAASYK